MTNSLEVVERFVHRERQVLRRDFVCHIDRLIHGGHDECHRILGDRFGGDLFPLQSFQLAFNEIDDPLRVPTGRVLLLPTPEELGPVMVGAR